MEEREGEKLTCNVLSHLAGCTICQERRERERLKEVRSSRRRRHFSRSCFSQLLQFQPQLPSRETATMVPDTAQDPPPAPSTAPETAPPAPTEAAPSESSGEPPFPSLSC